MDAEKFIQFRQQMTENNSDISDFISDINSWSSEVKQKEDKIRPLAPQSTALPPVRNSLLKKKKKKKHDPPTEAGESFDTSEKSSRIKAYDYRAWDKFDVDKELERMENDGDQKEASSEEEGETDEEWEDERRTRLAEEEKQKGNQRFKEGKFEEAVEHYTTGIRMEPSSAVLLSNRAMALLKLGRYAAAEVDCTAAINIDADFTKAHFRRGTARKNLGHLDAALQDFLRSLQLDPHNKAAQSEVALLEKEVNPSGIVQPINKTVEERSKAPLRQVLIEEVGPPTRTIGEGGLEMRRRPVVEVMKDSGPISPINGKGDHQEKCSVQPTTKWEPPPPVISTTLPPLPSSSVQLRRDLGLLSSQPPSLLAQYVCNIPADGYTALFKENMEPPQLVALLAGLSTALRTQLIALDGALHILEGLSRVPRFNVTWMFLSRAEKAGVVTILEQAREINSNSQQVINLSKTYS